MGKIISHFLLRERTESLSKYDKSQVKKEEEEENTNSVFISKGFNI